MSDETKQLAAFVADLQFHDLPAPVLTRATSAVRDALGVGIYGSRMPWSRMVAEFAAETSRDGLATIWGTPYRVTPPLAAMANGSAVQSIEMDDRSHNLDVHNEGASVSAVVGLAEQTGATGRDVLLAVVASYEVAFRVSRASVKTSKRRAGNPNTFGAAAGAAKILGLDALQTTHALGIAGGMAAGLGEILVSPDNVVPMVKRLQGGGWGGHSGVVAACLAQKGLTAPLTILEGQKGYLRSGAPEIEPDLGALTSGLGDGFEMLNWETKRYACWGGSHSSIEAIAKLREAHGFGPEDISGIHIRTSSKVHPFAVRPFPTTIMTAQYHLRFIVAASLFYDLGNPSMWTEEILSDPRIRTYSDLVEAEVDPEIDRKFREKNDAARVIVDVDLRDGSRRSIDIEHAAGRPDDPFPLEVLDQKFRTLTSQVLRAEQVDALSAWLDGLVDSNEPVDLGATARPLAEVSV